MVKFFLIDLEIINKGDIMAKRIIHQADLRTMNYREQLALYP